MGWFSFSCEKGIGRFPAADICPIFPYNNHTTDFNARAGIEFTVNTAHDGNKYDAGMRTFIQTDGGIYAMIYSNMLSIADGIGGGVNLGALYNDSVLSYKIGLDINVLF